MSSNPPATLPGAASANTEPTEAAEATEATEPTAQALRAAFAGAHRLGWFGGTFDPPHRAHIAVALAAAQAFALDRVLLAPAARQPLKPGVQSSSFPDPLHMVELACAAANHQLGRPLLHPSALDAPHPDGAPNFTIHTLRLLRQALPPQAALFCIVGADSFLQLRQWREPDALLATAEWIVLSRPGFDLDNLAPLNLSAAQLARVHLIQTVHLPISATALRHALHQHALAPSTSLENDAARSLDPAVLAYIHQHRLYSEPAPLR